MSTDSAEAIRLKTAMLAAWCVLNHPSRENLAALTTRAAFILNEPNSDRAERVLVALMQAIADYALGRF